MGQGCNGWHETATICVKSGEDKRFHGEFEGEFLWRLPSLHCLVVSRILQFRKQWLPKPWKVPKSKHKMPSVSLLTNRMNIIAFPGSVDESSCLMRTSTSGGDIWPADLTTALGLTLLRLLQDSVRLRQHSRWPLSCWGRGCSPQAKCRQCQGSGVTPSLPLCGTRPRDSV